MNAPKGVPTPDHLSPLASAILRYLAEHPDARDSVEGIHAWWLEDGEATWRRAEVDNAVRLLVAEGWIQSTTLGDAPLFSLQPERLADIRSRLTGGQAPVDLLESPPIEPRPPGEGDDG